jgi:RNA polymerase sigma-70 factor (ECF subfamily)
MTATPEFVEATEPFRRELLAHCYRMLGSVDDAEDLVQETYLRAWRSFGEFEGRSSVRTWLYRIATNACLNALTHSSRRTLPSGLAAPSRDPAAPLDAAPPGVRWLQPMPDAMVLPATDDRADPAAVAALRDSLRLALVASLQFLPPRQRVVLLLRDVLAWPAAEVAEALDTSTAAVKSALQRARARLEEVAPAAQRVSEPPEAEARALLDEYMAAFEHSDPVRLERLLRRDATLEMTGTTTWFQGLSVCMPFFVAAALGSPGEWRMVPVRANGQQAAAAYRLGPDGTHQAFGIAVLDCSADGVARIVTFGDPGLVGRFGLN